MLFENKVAVVTGAGSKKGIGQETARYLAEKGCKVVVADLNYEVAQEVAHSIADTGAETVAIKLDATDEASVSDMFAKTVERFGKIDILINCVGVTEVVSIFDMTLAQWNRIISINQTSIFLCCKAVLPYMVKNNYGRIVNMSSVCAKQGDLPVFNLLHAHYSASKAAILGFSKSIAREVLTNGITVNCVCPGPVQTEMGGGKKMPQEKLDLLPMKRMGTTREIAAMNAFLASDEAGYITGEDIDINGGMFMD